MPMNENCNKESLGHKFFRHYLQKEKIECVSLLIENLKMKAMTTFSDEYDELKDEQLQYIKYLNKTYNELRDYRAALEEQMENDGEMRMEDHEAFMHFINTFELPKSEKPKEIRNPGWCFDDPTPNRIPKDGDVSWDD